MSNSYSGICEYTGKEQTLTFDTNIDVSTFKNPNFKLQGRCECDNSFCPKSECPLYKQLTNQN